MKKLSIALAIALGTTAVAAIHAQTAPGAKEDQVTVTGCFERAVPEAVGTSGSLDHPPPPFTKWVLTEPAAAASGETAGTAGRRAKTAYRLELADEASVAAHEGHKVQITGTVKSESAEPGREETGRSASGQAPMLKVESIKMIASSCSDLAAARR
jgi:hypothetical protein